MTAGLQQILLVSPSNETIAELQSMLQSGGFTLSTASSVAEAKEFLAENGLPLGLLIDLQGLEDGLDFCNEMTLFAGLPVIVLGSETAERSTAVEALLYADSYLRPDETEPKELIARFSRLISRLSATDYSSGRKIDLASNLTVDFIRKVAFIDGEEIQLTPIEISLLHVLAVHRGAMVDNETLIERVWRGAPEGNGNSLRVQMHRLRKKLKWKKRQQRPIIRTVRGVGYALVDKAG